MLDFLHLFNEIAKVARPNFEGKIQLNEPLKDSGLDSLDVLMICIFLCEIYGIPEEVGKEMKPTTVQETEDFVKQHKTKEPSSVEEAVEMVK